MRPSAISRTIKSPSIFDSFCCNDKMNAPLAKRKHKKAIQSLSTKKATTKKHHEKTNPTKR